MIQPNLGISSHTAKPLTQRKLVKLSPSYNGGPLQKYLVKGLTQYSTEPNTVKVTLCNHSDASLLTGEYWVTGN